MRSAKLPHRRRILGVIVGIVAAVAVLFLVSGAWQPWWDSITMPGVNETITNDTNHAIMWECGTGDRTMRPGETETLRFALQPNDAGACSHADGVEMCAYTDAPDFSPHMNASDVLREWACS
jgi:hypothetical protein